MRRTRFGGPVRIGLSLRERMILIGGGAISMAAVALLVVAVSVQRDAIATVKVVPDEALDQPLMLGRVVLQVPVAHVPQGTKLDMVALREVYWPRNEVPQGALRRSDEVRGMYALEDLRPGEPILEQQLSSSPVVLGLSPLIPPGHRAMTIEVNATSGVEGWATPGVHVDVLVTYFDVEDNTKKSQIALEDAVVLSYNGRLDKGHGYEASEIVKTATVTLAIPVMDALKLATAQSMGQVSLILRHSGDTAPVGGHTFTERDFGERPRLVRERPDRDAQSRGFVRFRDRSGVEREYEYYDRRWVEVGDLS